MFVCNKIIERVENISIIGCLNFWDEACWFLSLRVFGLFIVFIFIVISTTFRSICHPAFFRYLSNSGTFTELRATSFIETTGVACSDSVSHSVSHNRVQQDTWRNGYRRWFPKLLRRQSSAGCRFNHHYRRVTIQEYLTLAPGYG